MGGAVGEAVGDIGAYTASGSTRRSRCASSPARRCSNPYLSQIERGLRTPSAEILRQIARALRISAEALYARAGIPTQRPRALVTRLAATPPSGTEAA